METGRRLILKDGTVIEDGTAGYSQGTLWLFFGGMALQEAAAIFFDPKKTKRIIFQYGEMEDVYDNFTECVSLQADMDGQISVCMVRRG